MLQAMSAERFGTDRCKRRESIRFRKLLREQLSRLGDTPFELGEVRVRSAAGCDGA